jgi:SAM-dependent methyltransferase
MAAGKNSNSWFKDWFNTPYYHLLYKHRDDHEAQLFIKNILDKTPVKKHWHFLDLACGRGRHAIFLNHQGYRVTGLDLAEENIKYAKQFETSDLQFLQADMREEYGQNQYHCLLNLFTSFGYFKSQDESAQACQQMAKALKPGGYLWLDFMNVHRVAMGLVPNEYRTINNIEFCISRKIEENQVIKEITFTDQGKPFRFQERVQLLELSNFKTFFKKAGLHLEATYGNYALEPFHEDQSDRLILMARA